MRAAQLSIIRRARALLLVAWLFPAVFALASCKGACDRLVSRFCECDPKFPENVRGCELARDVEKRKAAAEKARGRGKEIEQICREKLDNFDCPDRAAPEFYPGGFSFHE